MRPVPPTLARWWVALVLPREDRECYLGDLDQGFAERVARVGLREARAWYWREARSAPTRWHKRQAAEPSSGVSNLHASARDMRFAVRSVARRPATAVLAAATLAIGATASIACFAVLDGFLLRPLPYRDGSRLTLLREVRSDRTDASGMSYLNARDLADRLPAFSSVALVAPASNTLAVDGVVHRVNALGVSEQFFETLGITPSRGRMLTAADAAVRSPVPVVLTDAGWRTYFAGRADAVGASIAIDNRPALVVGIAPHVALPFEVDPVAFVAPASFEFGDASNRNSANGSRNFRMYPGAIARLAPAADRRVAALQASSAYAGLSALHPAQFASRSIELLDLRTALLGDRTRMLVLLTAIVLLVLSATTVSAAAVLVADALGRESDVLVRCALGASVFSVRRQFVFEGMLVAALGVSAGSILSTEATATLRRLLPDAMPRADALGPDWRVAIFAASLTAAIGIAVGCATMLAVRRQSLTISERRPTSRTQPLVEALVTAEVVFAVVLAVAAGMVTRSLVRLDRVAPGYDVTRVLTAAIDLTAPRFDGRADDPAPIAAYLTQIDRRVRALPGVSGVAFAEAVPLTGIDNETGVAVVGDGAASSDSATALRFVSSGYFRLLSIPLIAGRDFDSRDRSGTQPVAIVNAAFARAFLRGADPIGRKLHLGWGGDAEKVIVGVVGDVRHALTERPRPEAYVPQTQFGNRRVTLLVKAADDPEPIALSVVGALHAMDPSAPLPVPGLLETYRQQALAVPRFAAALAGGLAAMSVGLMVVGIFGVTRVLVSRRMHEFGVRVALGATAAEIRRLIVRHAYRPIAIGIGIGLPVAAIVARTLASRVYDVRAGEPSTLLVALVVVAGAGWLAIARPIRRATSVDPIEVLRDR